MEHGASVRAIDEIAARRALRVRVQWAWRGLRGPGRCALDARRARGDGGL